jgi:hypothetical protein
MVARVINHGPANVIEPSRFWLHWISFFRKSQTKQFYWD